MAPTGGLDSGRFEVTRPDAHHRLLFERAGLVLLESEPCPATETVVWVLSRTWEEGGARNVE